MNARRPAPLRSAPPVRRRHAAAERAGGEHVILLHGIWMRGVALAWLSHRLHRAGYIVHTMDYASVFAGFAPAVEELRGRLDAIDAPAAHVVGHSLGGLVALEAVRAGRRRPGRVVCLGSPLRGSAVARGLAAVPGGRWLLGHSVEPLLDGVADWRGEGEVGVIAGRLPLGLGALLGTLPAPHDGTVAVAETELPGIADHCLIDASHTGLLLSREAAGHTVRFLRSGRFAEA